MKKVCYTVCAVTENTVCAVTENTVCAVTENTVCAVTENTDNLAKKRIRVLTSYILLAMLQKIIHNVFYGISLIFKSWLIIYYVVLFCSVL